MYHSISANCGDHELTLRKALSIPCPRLYIIGHICQMYIWQCAM